MSAPVLERRTAEQLAQALLERLPAFAPGLAPAAGGSGHALLEIYARFLRALAERIDAAPDKNELAFLDLLGLDLLPAQAARAAVVFTTIPGGGDGHAPAGTRLAAKGADPARPLVFETERGVALTQARIAEVVSLWPGRDAFADHTPDALGGRPFTPWDGLSPVAHELYLAHDGHFALSGPSSVELHVELAPGGSERLDLDWSWWDGDGWRSFKELREQDQPGWSLDATSGLTRSGAVRLATDCGASVKRVVGGWNAHWLRARVVRPLPPDPARVLPRVDRIWLQTVIDRRLPSGAACSAGLLPDTAFAGAEKLDATKPFFPLGRAPSPDVAFYLACDDAFSRPGAAVEICLDRAVTEQERADAEAARFALDVTSAVRHVVDAARKGSLAVQKIADAIVAMAPPSDGGAATVAGLRSALVTATTNLQDMSGLDAVASAAKQLADALPAVSIAIPDVVVSDVDEQATRDRIQAAADTAAAAVRDARADIVSWADVWGLIIASMAAGAVGALIFGGLDEYDKTNHAARAVLDAATAIKDLGATNLDGVIADLQGSVNRQEADQFDPKAKAITDQLDAGYSVGPVMHDVHVPDTATLLAGRRDARARGLEAAVAGDEALLELAKLSPLEAAAAAGKLEPTLAPPELAWEYWDGEAWRRLVADPADDAVNLRASGSFSFETPGDWETLKVNGTEARWLRARITAGVFGKLTLVSWKDEDHQVRFLPIVEPRPPQLDALRIGYLWRSRPAPPEHVLCHNDFAWEDHTEDAAWRGGTFEPFRPVADATPALYLGFDGPLPADELGLFLDAEEVVGEESGPSLVWERWDGSRWAEVVVADETAGLAVPGIARVTWPGDAPVRAAQVVSAAAREIVLGDPREAAAFAAGDDAWLAAGTSGELVRVAAVTGTSVLAQAPVTKPYGAATLAQAALPRFGTPRAWLRARLRADGDPRLAVLRGVHANATWASQTETVEGEVLGSASGEPLQSFFLTRTPVLRGEEIEVRELDGPRAEVELPLLVDALAAAGIAESELRIVRDARTGHATEVWVPWRGRPSLGFSGPDDRHYTIERTRGRVRFGDGRHGRIPPAGADGVRARSYRSGGGPDGNVPAGAIAQVVSGTFAAGVANPRAAEGGAATEPDAAVLARGPLTVRNRRQAVSAADYEALAHEASPAVAVARAATSRGAVSLTVVPFGPEARPLPTWQLRREVRDFVATRMPAAAGSLAVLPPVYFDVGVRAVVAPVAGAEPGPAAAAAKAALAAFLHPLTGGPQSRGWPFGRDVFLGDLAALLEALPGVDHVSELVLVVGGAPQGERVRVPGDRLVAAGTLDVELGGASR